MTGFLGPNGAGKSTTIRAVLGLDTPDAGRALVGGVAYRDLEQPLRHVGALLDAGTVHRDRVPSLSFALLDLALYLTLAGVLGAWRFTRDA